MRGCITLQRPRLFGARLHIHWSALVAGGILFGVFIREQPAHALIAVLGYFGVILLHEAGHAFVAKKLGYPPSGIYLTFVHGLCQYEQPYSLKEDAIIAWAGVLAQLALAVPLIILGHTTPLGSVPIVAFAISILGHWSLLMALFNLLPLRGLDGALAWKLVPILADDIRYRSASKKVAKDVIRRFK